MLMISAILIVLVIQCGDKQSESQRIGPGKKGDTSTEMADEFSAVTLALKYYQLCLFSYFKESFSRNMYDIISRKITNPVDVLFPESLDQARKYLPVQFEVKYESILPLFESGLDSRWCFSVTEKRYDDYDKYRWTIEARSTSKSVFGNGVVLELCYQRSEYNEFEFVYAWSLTRDQQREIVKNSPNGARDVIFK